MATAQTANFTRNHRSAFPRSMGRTRSGLRNDRSAVTGFFEDLPTLLIAIIALLIFFGQVTAMYNTYESRWKDIEFKNDAEGFARAVRGYEGLAHNNREGVLEGTKIVTITSERVAADLQPDFRYKIEIRDLGDYPVKYETMLANDQVPGNSPITAGEGVAVIRSPIVIWVSEEELHPGLLTVTIW